MIQKCEKCPRVHGFELQFMKKGQGDFQTTVSATEFQQLALLGGKLVKIHLMEDEEIESDSG